MAKDSGPLAPRSSRAEVDAFLKKVAQTVPTAAGGRGRLMFALDATASREPTWDRACQIQGQMFAETAALGGLDVQIVYYRGFGEFEASGWIGRSADLLAVMRRVFCVGGETQIRKVLEHAIAETKRRRVNALVFVGDCCEEDVDALCALAGQLGLLSVPVFLFQEGDDQVATRAFKQIARLTNGAHCRFDASSAQQLRDLLSVVAVYAAGGRRALEDYGRRVGGDVPLLTRQVR
jgi:hypothetical protein